MKATQMRLRRKRLERTLTPGGGAGQRERAAQLALDGAQRAQDVVGVAPHARRAPPLAPRAHRGLDAAVCQVIRSRYRIFTFQCQSNNTKYTCQK